MPDFVGKRWIYFGVSGVVILIGIIALFIPPSLRPSIEFTGGSSLDVTFTEPVEKSAVQAVLADMGHPEAVVQLSGLTGVTGAGSGKSYFIRTKELASPVINARTGEVLEPGEKEQIQQALEERLAPLESVQFFSVSPVIAAETVRNAAIAVVVGILFVLAYIIWAFRGVAWSYRYGISAILALVHDVLVVVGIYSLLTKFTSVEVNTMFIIGILTIIGYSVNDTIVVFDRIRENLVRGVGRTFTSTVNTSILETLGRSLNTSLTLLFVLLALMLFGGASIVDLLVVLLIGLIAGTYSSIAIASQFLVMWERGELGRLVRRIPLPLPQRSS